MSALITEAQFALLRHGDIVKYGRKNPVLRTVLYGPADDARDSKHPAVAFPIRRRSWTGRVTTTYGYNDIKHLIAPTGLRLTGLAASAEEMERLYLLGFGVAKGMAREFYEQNRRGWVKCSVFWRGTISRTIKLAKELRL